MSSKFYCKTFPFALWAGMPFSLHILFFSSSLHMGFALFMIWMAGGLEGVVTQVGIIMQFAVVTANIACVAIAARLYDKKADYV